MWNSKQQPLLKEDHLKEEKLDVNDEQPKRKRYSHSFHQGRPPTTSSPQSLPLHRGSTNSTSFVPSSHTASNSNYGQSHVRGTMFSNLNQSQSNEMNEPSVLSSHNGDNDAIDSSEVESDDDVSIDHLDTDELDISHNNGKNGNNGNHSLNNKNGSNNNNNNNNGTNGSGIHSSLSSLDSEKVPRNQDPLSHSIGSPGNMHNVHLGKSGTSGHGKYSNYNLNNHHTIMTSGYNNNYNNNNNHTLGQVSVIDDDSQLSAVLPGGAKFAQRINNRNQSHGNLLLSSNEQQHHDRSLGSLHSVPAPNAMFLNNKENRRGKSKRMKIGTNGKKKKNRADTAYVPAQSLQKTFVTDANQSHSLQEQYLHGNKKNQNHSTKVRLNSQNIISSKKQNDNKSEQIVSKTKVFRPRDVNSYHILEDEELPQQAKEAKIRARMRSKESSKRGRKSKKSGRDDSSTLNSGKAGARARQKEVEEAYQRRFDYYNNRGDLDLLDDSEATSSCESSDDGGGFNYTHMMKQHKRKSHLCRNYICCCICCLCNRNPDCDRRYTRFKRSISKVWKHKTLMIGVIFLLWFIVANSYFWLNIQFNFGEKYFTWIPQWFENERHFLMVNLIIGSICVLFLLYSVSNWYSMHYAYLDIKRAKLKHNMKFQSAKKQARVLEATKQWLCESNTSLETSFDCMTTLNENFETLLQKYDINLHKLSQFYDDLMVNIQSYQDNESMGMNEKGEEKKGSEDDTTKHESMERHIGAEEDDVKITENEDIVIDLKHSSNKKKGKKYEDASLKDATNALIHNRKEITLLDGYIRDSLNMLLKLTRMFTKYNYKMEAIILKKLKKDLEIESRHLFQASNKLSADSAGAVAPHTPVGNRLQYHLRAHSSPGIGNSVGGVPSQYHNAPIRSLGTHAVSFQSNYHKRSSDSTAFGMGGAGGGGGIGGDGMTISQYDHFIAKIPKKYRRHFLTIKNRLIEERDNDGIAYPGPAFEQQQQAAAAAGIGTGNVVGNANVASYSDLHIAYSDIGSVLSAILRNAPGSPKKGSNTDPNQQPFGFVPTMSSSAAPSSQQQAQHYEQQAKKSSTNMTLASRPSMTGGYLSVDKSGMRSRMTENDNGSFLSMNSGTNRNSTTNNNNNSNNNNNNNNNISWNLNIGASTSGFDSSDDELGQVGQGARRFVKTSTSTDKGDPSLQISEINDVDGGYLVYGDDDMIVSSYHTVGKSQAM